MRDKNEVFFWVFVMGVMLGFITAVVALQTITKPNIAYDVLRMQTLTQRGTRATMDSRVRVWVWDEQNRVSYEADGYMLNQMCERKP